MRYSPKKNTLVAQQEGFTLIEIIAGIVVLSIAFSVLTTIIYPLSQQGAGQVHQIRAAELGQSMVNEILGKAFDENSDMSGGLIRCGEFGIACTAASALGPEEASRQLFDDVDDYDGLNTIVSSLGNSDSLDDIYIGFNILVTVINDSDYDGDSDNLDNNSTAKLITVEITTPQKSTFTFAVYKVNF